MPKAIWNDTVIAESDNYEMIEGNTYFPADSLKMEYFKESPTTSVCVWKGTANYYTIVVDGKENTDAAWVYKKASNRAKNIEGYVAFWKGVEIKA